MLLVLLVLLVVLLVLLVLLVVPRPPKKTKKIVCVCFCFFQKCDFEVKNYIVHQKLIKIEGFRGSNRLRKFPHKISIQIRLTRASGVFI